jgi:ABC-type transporter Mla MlaB component
MLRITVTDLPDEQRWLLQGRLVGPWAAELRLVWRNTRRESDTRKCIVDLNDVTSIDQNGKAVLQEIMSQNPEFVTSSIYTKQILENLRKELERKSDKEGQGK